MKKNTASFPVHLQWSQWQCTTGDWQRGINPSNSVLFESFHSMSFKQSSYIIMKQITSKYFQRRSLKQVLKCRLNAITQPYALTFSWPSEHSQPSVPRLVSLWQLYLANEGFLQQQSLSTAALKCICCQTYLRWEKVNYVLARALSLLSDIPGVCTEWLLFQGFRNVFQDM